MRSQNKGLLTALKCQKEWLTVWLVGGDWLSILRLEGRRGGGGGWLVDLKVEGGYIKSTTKK